MNCVDIIESLERRTLFAALVFFPPVSYSTGAHPAQIVTADLTGNGTIDLITANFGAASIGVLRGNGNGTFQPAALYAAGTSPEALAVGDFNGDGFPDIVTANEGSNTVSVLMGIGDGTFAPQVTYAVGVRPEGVIVADLNGSGLLDIVTVDEGSDTISVLMNAGNGTFGPAVAYFAGVQPSGIAAGDLNADGRPDIVTTSPALDGVHVLLNNGLGAFAINNSYATGQLPRGVAIADLNSDARPDIISASISARSISVLTGIGNGTFNPATDFISGGKPLAVVVADVNGDGRPDVLTADIDDKDIAVLRRVGLAGFARSKSFHAGDGPTSLAVADVNGDGRPDIVAADFDNASISVMINDSVFVPLIPTTATLTSSQNPVEVKNTLVLSAQVTKSLPSRNNPGGVVQFFDGNTVLGVVQVSAGGVARLGVRNLSIGTHTITAHYGGNSIFAGFNTNTISEVVVTPQQATPFVEPSILAVHLPNDYVPGVRGVADVSIRASGAARAVGTVGVKLYASTTTTFDSTAIPLVMQGDGQINLRLIGNQSRTIPITFFMPGNITPGNYTIFAALVPITGLTAAQVSAVPAVGLTTQQAVLQFGAVSSQRGLRLTRTLANGDTYTAAISGPGTGNVTENADGGISIALTGTNGGSAVAISSTTGVTLDGLTETSAVGSIIAPTTNLIGTANLQPGVRQLTLGNITDSQLSLSGSAPNTLTFGNVSNVNLFSASPIKSILVSSYTNQPGDVITTAWIGSIHSTGDFGASLVINGGTGPANRGLNTAIIGGAVGNSSWRILANAGNVQVGSVAAGWSGSVRGSIQSFVDLGDFAGQFAAHQINNFQINGNMINAVVLAGADFGDDGRIGNNDDVFGSGTLNILKVGGSVTTSTIAAGLKPVGIDLLAPGFTLLPRSAIRAVTIGQMIDTPSRLVSITLPKTASINGNEVTTAGNANFG